MLITRIELENIKSYRQVIVDFRPGTTAISGSNGAGKTTLVEAIGFALFDYLPYKQQHFVREGEKSGKVVVHLLASDDRPYVVERRCGSGSRWWVHDVEADIRLEQSADVQDKLHELFGIDRERSLELLFRDALGVPQGTFTAVFLETASKRKATFDALLQIEDYRTASDYLLNTQKVYRESLHEQDLLIQKLSLATQDLPTWRTTLATERLTEGQQAAQLAEMTQNLASSQHRASALIAQQTHIHNLTARHDNARTVYTHALTLLQEREQALDNARTAQNIVTNSLPDYERYEQTQITLNTLRQQARTRDTLRHQRSTLSEQSATARSEIKRWQDELTKVQEAHTEVARLTPLVAQQAALEERLQDAIQRARQYASIVDEGSRIRKQFDKFVKSQDEYKQLIAEVEPLIPIAQKLEENFTTLNTLKLQAGERSSKQRQLQEKRETLRHKQAELAQYTDRLQRYEQRIALVESHRAEAERFPELQTRQEETTSRLLRLEGNIEGYVKSRAQSAGGQCPLLHESCLNIRQHGISSLESYFDSLLTEEHAQVSTLQADRQKLTLNLQRLKPYADELGKLPQYTEQRDNYQPLIANTTGEIARLEQEIATLTTELASLQTIESRLAQAQAAYTRSQEADTRVRDRSNWQNAIATLENQIQQLDLDLKERRHEASKYRSGQADAETLKTELATLGDPRTHLLNFQNIIAQDGYYTRQLYSAENSLSTLTAQIQELDEQLALHNSLDHDMAHHEQLLSNSTEGHRQYLRYRDEAQTLPTREQSYQHQRETTESAHQAVSALALELQTATDAFDADELVRLTAHITRLTQQQTELATTMQYQQQKIAMLEQDIAYAEARLVELETAQQEHRTLDDLQSMTEHFRRLIKDAAPHVLKAMLNDISTEANRIFGEIMGDRSAQLSWRNDYEITLRRQGVDRTFAQLSGGEQMSAALAVRLALLKKLSTLNLAFFDEPTQNMDELRRMNLAEQIRRVRGFDQLLVISHDDTFEQGLDSLVRLKKVNTETRVLEDDGVSTHTPLQEAWQNDNPSVFQHH